MSNRPNRRPARPVPGRPGAAEDAGARRTVWIVAAVVGLVVVVGAVAWLLTSRQESTPVLDAQATRGQQLAISKGCVSCHTSSGNVSEGPTWKGLYGRTEQLEAGGTVTVDDNYIRESILDPQAKIVTGFTGTKMPPYQGQLEEKHISALIEYIKKLK